MKSPHGARKARKHFISAKLRLSIRRWSWRQNETKRDEVSNAGIPAYCDEKDQSVPQRVPALKVPFNVSAMKSLVVHVRARIHVSVCGFDVGKVHSFSPHLDGEASDPGPSLLITLICGVYMIKWGVELLTLLRTGRIFSC